MKHLFDQLVEKAKADKKLLKTLKMAAVEAKVFELAANLRQIENDIFPETEETKKAKEEARELNLLFRMVELNVPEDTCWLLAETLKAYSKRKGKFNVSDAVKLTQKHKQIFDKE